MALCLYDTDHGYYLRGDPLGAAGDFVTAPEVSQMFGEMIGLWAAEVWQEMLQVGAIGVEDNFFNLGGHSLLATIVAHRVQQKTGRRPGLRGLMFQTLEQLARSLEADARVASP